MLVSIIFRNEPAGYAPLAHSTGWQLQTSEAMERPGSELEPLAHHRNDNGLNRQELPRRTPSRAPDVEVMQTE